jgi:hypothetical protein
LIDEEPRSLPIGAQFGCDPGIEAEGAIWTADTLLRRASGAYREAQ